MSVYQKQFPSAKGLQLIPMIARDFKKLTKSELSFYNKKFFEIKERFLVEEEKKKIKTKKEEESEGKSYKEEESFVNKDKLSWDE